MARNVLAALLLLLMSAGLNTADVIYDVSLNTGPLIGNPNAPFALDFQLTSGDTGSGVVNTVKLSQVHFGSGGSPGTGNPFANSGNASGTLSSTVILNTSGGTFFNEFSQYFTPGSALSFQLDLGNNAEPPPTPDEFTFQLIDSTGGPIQTTDPSGSSSLLIADLTGSALQVQTYTTDGDGISVSPQVTLLTSTTPEPSAFLLAAAGFVAIGALAFTRSCVYRFSAESGRTGLPMSDQHVSESKSYPATNSSGGALSFDTKLLRQSAR